jgi:hypothetical protein
MSLLVPTLSLDDTRQLHYFQAACFSVQCSVSSTVEFIKQNDQLKAVKRQEKIHSTTVHESPEEK